jgi:tRNA-splicing ligase RtcB
MDREYREAGILVNTDGHVPIDEAGPCYKSSEEVINAVTGAGLARIEYSLWPLASLKGAEEGRSRKAKRKSEKESERRSEKGSERGSSDHY